MNLKEAFDQLLKDFPYSNYINSDILGNAYKETPEIVLKYLPIGSKILDFGCGPCDKTAILQKLGYNCTGYDDLQDDWHLEGENRDTILKFIEDQNIKFIESDYTIDFPFKKCSFDMIILNDVIEHLHDSPRTILNNLAGFLKEDGLMLITVPNGGNIRKRIDLLFGRTNYPPFEGYYWSKDPWRDHIREYVYDDLKQLAQFLKMETLELKGIDQMLTNDKLPEWLWPFWKLVTFFYPSWKDSWLLLMKKNKDWSKSKDPKKVDGYTFYPNLKKKK